MAANFWASTQHRYWLVDRDTLQASRQELESEERNLVQQYPLPDVRLLSRFFNERKHAVDINKAERAIFLNMPQK